MSDDWHVVGNADDIDEEDVVRATAGDLDLAIYNAEGGFYATGDLCTDEQASLSEGVVIDDIIECPLHQGRFHMPTGEPKRPPVALPIRTYPVKVEGGKISVRLDGEEAPANAPAGG